MRKINEIIVHCSDSEWGDAKIIDEWHKERKWKGIGYHYVICNGFLTYCSYKNKKRKNKDDGILQTGRPIEEIGSHVKGRNSNSIGICLIGKKDFTDKQFDSLMKLMYKLLIDYPIGLNIYGHYETKSGAKQGKTCPNIDMPILRHKFLDYLLMKLMPNP